MQTGEVDGRSVGGGRGQLGGLKVVGAILVAQLELRGEELVEQLLVPVERLLLLLVVRTGVERAFVDRAVGPLFPAGQDVVAVGAPVGSFRGAQMGSDLGEAATNFAAQLAGLAAIVGVEIVTWRATVGTTTSARQRIRSGALNGRERSAVLALVLAEQLPPVQSGGGRGRLSEGSTRINGKVAIVGMLLAEVVAGLRLGLTAGEDRLQLGDEFLQILTGKLSAEPKYQSWYVAHGGESLGNLAGSYGDVERETSPPFCWAVKPPKAGRNGRPAGCPTWLRSMHKGGERRNANFPKRLKGLPALRFKIFDRTQRKSGVPKNEGISHDVYENK